MIFATYHTVFDDDAREIFSKSSILLFDFFLLFVLSVVWYILCMSLSGAASRFEIFFFYSLSNSSKWCHWIINVKRINYILGCDRHQTEYIHTRKFKITYTRMRKRTHWQTNIHSPKFAFNENEKQNLSAAQCLNYYLQRMKSDNVLFTNQKKKKKWRKKPSKHCQFTK